MVWRPSSFTIFKHEYLCNQWADHNQILSEASLGLEKGCIRFWARSDQNTVSMATESSHRVIMEKMVSPLFLGCFSSDLFILAGNDDMHDSSGEFESPTAE